MNLHPDDPAAVITSPRDGEWDVSVALASVVARENDTCRLLGGGKHSYTISCSPGAVFAHQTKADTEITIRREHAAASAALALSYGFGSSVDPQRVQLARQRPAALRRLARGNLDPDPDTEAATTLAQLAASLSAQCRIVAPAVASVLETHGAKSCTDPVAVALVVGTLMQQVMSGDCTSTFVQTDALDVRSLGATAETLQVSSAEPTSANSGRITDGDGHTKALVHTFRERRTEAADGQLTEGELFAYVELTESYDADLVALANFVGDALAEGADESLRCNEDEGLELEGLEGVRLSRVGLCPHGWFAVADKMKAAAAHSLVVDVSPAERTAMRRRCWRRCWARWRCSTGCSA